MSNYTKTTDFEAKDSLPTGDSGKIIRGAEFETEFDAIATAITTKADTAGPTFTGTLTFETISDGTIGVTAFVDEDNMASDSATLVPTQQSVKAYVDSQVTAQDLDFQADSGGALSIDLDSEALTLTGGTGIDTSGALNEVTFAIDSTVATLTGTQTLTNKTLTAPTISGNLTTDGNIDGRDVATDGAKLDGIESGATADQTAAEIRTLVDSATDSNVFTDADHTKLDGIEASATADQTDAEIRAAVEAATDSNVFTDADHTKLDGIEASADVTDTANVTAAGALMDSEVTNLAQVKAFDSADYATAAQGTTADSALQNVVEDTTPQLGGDLASNGNDILFADNDKAIFGAGSDLEIYHSGSHSFISEGGTGDLYIGASNNIALMNAAFSENKLLATTDGAIKLYYDGSQKLATTSTGIDVTGTVTADAVATGTSTFTGSLTIDAAGASVTVKDSNDGGTVAFVFENDSGTTSSIRGASSSQDIQIKPNEVLAANFASGGDISFYEDTGTTAKLFWDASAESLGIGTTTPSYNLAIRDDSTSSYPLSLESNSMNTSGAHVGIRFGYAGNQYQKAGIIYESTDATGYARGKLLFALEGTADASNADETDAKMAIDYSGNVGIGTSSPSALGHFYKSNAESKLLVEGDGAGASAKVAIDGHTTAQLDLTYRSNTSSKTASLIHQTNGDLAINTLSVERMRIDASGNLLVGKTSSGLNTAGFEVASSGRTRLTRDGNNVVEVNRKTSDGSLVTFSKDATTVGSIQTNSGRLDIQGNANTVRVQSGTSLMQVTNGTQISFETAGAERMRIDSSGNLLVGKSSAGGVATVGAELRGSAGYVISTASSDKAGWFGRNTTDGDIVGFYKDGTAVGSIGSVAGQDIVIGSGSASLRFLSSGPAIQPRNADGTANNDAIDIGLSGNRFKDLYLSGVAYANNFVGVSDTDTGIDINGTNVMKFNTGGSEAARFDSSGNLLVGTSSDDVTNGSVVVKSLQNVNTVIKIGHKTNSITGGDFVACYYNNVQIGGVAQNGTTGVSFNTSSDQRLKENIVDAPSASDDIDAIQVRSFDWKADGSHQKYGMVAQELNTVAPEAVSAPEDSEEMMGVDYSKLVPMMLKEIQSLRARVAQLEGEA